MSERKKPGKPAEYTNPAGGDQIGVGGLGRAPSSAGGGDAGSPGRGSAGRIGTVIEGIAGRAGGWWAGEGARQAAEDLGEYDEHYRRHFEQAPDPDVDYDAARIGYGVGHVAGRNPEYRDREFADVERTLRSHWSGAEHDYDTLRPYIREGYERGSRTDTTKGNPLA